KPSNDIPPHVLEAYDRLVGAERKGASMPYTSMNGNMYSFLDKSGGMGLRLPAAEREAFMEKYATALSVQHGAVMKEYVAVPAALLENLDELKPYFEESQRYASSLKPKPTKKGAK